jgi:hypothetical protein
MAKPKKPAPFDFKIAPAAACVQKQITLYRKLPSGEREAVMRKNPVTGRVEPIKFMATRKVKGAVGKCAGSEKVHEQRGFFAEAARTCMAENGGKKKTFTPAFHTCMRENLTVTPDAAKPKKPSAAKPKKPRGKKAK